MDTSSLYGVFRLLLSNWRVVDCLNTHVQPNDLQLSCSIQSLPLTAGMVLLYYKATCLMDRFSHNFDEHSLYVNAKSL